jgi:hypothetical protein
MHCFNERMRVERTLAMSSRALFCCKSLLPAGDNISQPFLLPEIRNLVCLQVHLFTGRI